MTGHKLLSLRIGFVLVCAIAVITSCKSQKKEASSEKKEQSQEAQPVVAAKAIRMKLNDKILLMGDVRGIREADVYPKVPGKLQEYRVKERQWVKKNQVIAVVDQDLTGVKYNPALIKAPFSGMVVQLYLDPGEVVNPPTMSRTMGTPIARVADLKKVRIVMHAPDRFVNRIHPGMPVEINLSGTDRWIRRGKVTRITPQVDPLTRTFLVEATVPNHDGLFVPGMFARVRVITRTEKDALVIPREALVSRNGKTIVMKVEDGVVREVEVKTGIVTDLYVQILSGLEKNDMVIVMGPDLFHEGDRVTIAEELHP